MVLRNNPSAPPLLDVEGIDFLSVLDRLDDGVMITDRRGTIHFYNRAQAKIDGIPAEEAMGMKVTQIYELNRRTSLVMQSIIHNASIKNKTFFYRTAAGKVVNSITSAYPLYTKTGKVNGAICFVKDYERLRRSTPMPPREPFHTDLGNGTRFRFSDIIGSSHWLKKVIGIAKKAADSASPIMIQGETGTGKELVAQAIHNHSPRRDQKFVAVNCAAIPHDLLEGMLFGTSRGAFTGALDKPGLFEMAHGSTIFLDELLAMPVDLQAKLLRALQDKRVRRLGSLKETRVDVKIISSVNQDPRTAIREEKLRTDLYYRLGVVMVKLPPLRQRLDTMEELAGHFIKKYNTRLGTNVKSISREVMELFMAYRWPGNIRELEHLIEGAMNMAGQDEAMGIQHFGPGLDCLEHMDTECMDPAITMITQPPQLPVHEAAEPPENFTRTQKQREETAVKAAMTKAAGNVTRAAEILGISRQLLHYKLKKLGLRRVDFMR
ncbi:MAG: sigma 54-interacting transcriptional regulator [Desulfobacter sp.]|nr:MAG: sigma 54-interacting transcriptional regulator [Desulfobacter sp.]